MKTFPLPLLGALALMPLLTSCGHLFVKRVVFEKHPIAVKVSSEVADDEESLDHILRFRNVGREVLSFDYTVSDEVGVPHVDQFGPNSGLVKNLYPGAEVEMPNPNNLKAVHVTLGTVTYGKKDENILRNMYDPKKAFEEATAVSEDPLLGDPGLGLLEPDL